MKLYGFLGILLFGTWIIVSLLFPEPSWWSIFTSDRSTHTPLMEQLSVNKVFFITIIFIGLAYILHLIFQKGS
ncbi:hypothetical protein AF332_27245 [Sporosarcina globispora]|uniref:Uncharacterized protein n=1 Tax=Sporosarcina globispora TaxID=1459 RepID=A0A0M0GKV7_SPOGL|nr:hypothetical protein AF332_27245 [Sporosarcina globispora]